MHHIYKFLVHLSRQHGSLHLKMKLKWLSFVFRGEGFVHGVLLLLFVLIS